MERLIKSSALQNVSDYHVILFIGCSRSCSDVEIIHIHTSTCTYIRTAIKLNARSLSFFQTLSAHSLDRPGRSFLHILVHYLHSIYNLKFIFVGYQLLFSLLFRLDKSLVGCLWNAYAILVEVGFALIKVGHKTQLHRAKFLCALWVSSKYK